MIAAVEFAHVKPTGLDGPGRGMERRYRDVLKNPDCYRVLCKECHRKADRENMESQQCPNDW